MKDKVQLHVDVPHGLWKSIKQVALDSGGTLKQTVVAALEKTFGDDVKPVDLKVGKVVLGPATEPVLPKSTHTGTCSKCGAKGVKTTINREMKEVCYKCAGVPT